MDLQSLTREKIRKLSNQDLRRVASEILTLQARDMRENALFYYVPVTQEAEKVHLSNARTIGIGGGNGSSKTETALVEVLMLATGVVPRSLEGKIDPKTKMRGPVHCRVVCESLTTVLHPIIIPKLQYWKWTGIDRPGGPRGHWGWIPRASLKGGSWDKSWSEKLRTLTLLYRDPWDFNNVQGESTIQFMSIDQDASDFASGDYHIVLHDEPPNQAIWRENEARTMRVAGRMLLAMTWPDDPAIAVDWIHDEIYEPAQSGKNALIEWFNFYTTDNPHLDQEAIQLQSEKWDEETRKVRLYGQPIRFSNRIHPLFTDRHEWWCFSCGRSVLPVKDRCSCGSAEVTPYCHVSSFDANPTWPTVFLLDPHPRKPHAMCWVQVSPNDDLWQVAELEIDADPPAVREAVDTVESERSLGVTMRVMDPNMGRSPASTRRGVTWQDEFDSVGLVCDLADDSDVGRSRVNEYLRPDPRTWSPRIQIHETCSKTIYQFKRYVWDDYRRALEKDLKQKPKTKYDDFPTLWKYLMNLDPTFGFMRQGSQVIRRRRA